jgi:hypothetical protein
LVFRKKGFLHHAVSDDDECLWILIKYTKRRLYLHKDQHERVGNSQNHVHNLLINVRALTSKIFQNRKLKSIEAKLENIKNHV